MKMLSICLAAVACMLSACASGPETAQSASAREQREYVTGSNLPQRNRMGGDNVRVMTPEEFDRAREAGGQGDRGVMSQPGAAR